MSSTPILAGKTPDQFVDEQIAEYTRLGWKKEALREAFRASFNCFSIEDFQALTEPKRNSLLLFLRLNGVQIALERGKIGSAILYSMAQGPDFSI